MTKIRYKLIRKLPRHWIHTHDPIGTIFEFSYCQYTPYVGVFTCQNPNCTERFAPLLINYDNIRLNFKPLSSITIKKSIYVQN